MKQYIANTPLILQDENGVDVRIERGAVVSLSDTQYEEVAAHVTAIATDEPSEAEAPPETLPENNQAEQVETPDSTAEIEATANAEAESTTTAKRGKAKSAE